MNINKSIFHSESATLSRRNFLVGTVAGTLIMAFTSDFSAQTVFASEALEKKIVLPYCLVPNK